MSKKSRDHGIVADLFAEELEDVLRDVSGCETLGDIREEIRNSRSADIDSVNWSAIDPDVVLDNPQVRSLLTAHLQNLIDHLIYRV